jgi:hypothetical protein
MTWWQVAMRGWVKPLSLWQNLTLAERRREADLEAASNAVRVYYDRKETAPFTSEVEERKANITAFAKYAVAMNTMETASSLVGTYSFGVPVLKCAAGGSYLE